jgi:CubicO group peptidase (beta-lactamase class C family)
MDMKALKLIATAIAIMICAAPQYAQAQSACNPPQAGLDSWQIATPESVGLSSNVLCSMVKWLEESKKVDVHAVVIARHGKLAFEHYFTGDDEHLGHSVGKVAFNAQTRHDERSVSKSVTALLVGIAIGRGRIKSIDEPIFSFFPQYADLRSPEKARITLRDLLTMSSGLEWHEIDVGYTTNANDEIRMDLSPEPHRYALTPSMVAAPGTQWNYDSGSTELLGAVLRKATGKPVNELARTLVFGPLGITDVEWYPFPDGNVSAAAGLRLRPRDLAKIGQLILQRGAWNGVQIVPASWIDAATSPHIMGPGLFFYGYQFWLGRSLVNQHEVLWASAVGLGGQRVYVVPDLDLVVVVNAGMYASPQQGDAPLEILNRYAIGALTDAK